MSDVSITDIVAEARAWKESALPPSPWGDKHIAVRLADALEAAEEQLAAAQAVIAEIRGHIGQENTDSWHATKLRRVRAILPQPLADALEAVKHRVWREGFDAGERDVMQHEESTFDTPCIPSPYRAATIEGEKP